MMYMVLYSTYYDVVENEPTTQEISHITYIAPTRY